MEIYELRESSAVGMNSKDRPRMRIASTELSPTLAIAAMKEEAAGIGAIASSEIDELARHPGDGPRSVGGLCEFKDDALVCTASSDAASVQIACAVHDDRAIRRDSQLRCH